MYRPTAFYFVNTHKTKFEASVVPEHVFEVFARYTSIPVILSAIS